MRQGILAIARLAERGLERIGHRAGPPVLEPYRGYATPEGWVLRGRVLTHLRRTVPEPQQSKWVNARQMLSLFLTDEVEGVEVRARGVRGRSDAEGYVRLVVPPAAGHGGWAEVDMEAIGPDGQVADRATCRVQVPPDPCELIVISDIDDTLIETGAYSLLRNLWTTLTGSALSRHAHPDAVALLQALCGDGAVPVYYVSSSPWNLHGFLSDLFARERLPEGPTFLRDLGLTPEGGIGAGHADHKTLAIDTILDANPKARAVLLGDTGQKDPQIYADIVRRNPSRFRGIALRATPAVSPDIHAAHLDAIEKTGVPCHVAPSFDGALAGLGLAAARPVSPP